VSAAAAAATAAAVADAAAAPAAVASLLALLLLRRSATPRSRARMRESTRDNRRCASTGLQPGALQRRAANTHTHHDENASALAPYRCAGAPAAARARAHLSSAVGTRVSVALVGMFRRKEGAWPRRNGTEEDGGVGLVTQRSNVR
jgi:hypothetical protein